MEPNWPTWYKYKESKSLYGCSHFCCWVVWSASLNSVYSQNSEWEPPKEGVPLWNTPRKLGDFPTCNFCGWCTGIWNTPYLQALRRHERFETCVRSRVECWSSAFRRMLKISLLFSLRSYFCNSYNMAYMYTIIWPCLKQKNKNEYI
jgi:hypothetical protein